MKRLIELIEAKPSEEECIQLLEKLYWNGSPISPFDPTSKVYKCKIAYKCRNTGKYFNVKALTLFDNKKLGLMNWFKAILIYYPIRNNPCKWEVFPISSFSLAKKIGVTQKSAWFMLRRLKDNADKLETFVNLLET